jgi:hypothetical protein
MKYNQFKRIGKTVLLKTLTALALISPILSSHSQTISLSQPQPTVISQNLDSTKQIGNMHYQERKLTLQQINQIFTQQLQEYQKIGLYNSINNVHFRVEIDSPDDDSANYVNQTVTINLSKNSTANNPILQQNEFTNLSLSINKTNQYNIQKVLAHELGHVQYSQNQQLTTDTNLNHFMNSEFIQLGGKNGDLNNNYQHIQENIADTYGELAYLKRFGFTNQNIQHLKLDIQTRLQDQKKLSSEYSKLYGSHFDSHDTVQSLQTLLRLVENQTTRQQLESISGNDIDLIAKHIVFNSYFDYIQQPDIQKNLQNSIFNLSKNQSAENKNLIQEFQKISQNPPIKYNLTKELSDLSQTSNHSNSFTLKNTLSNVLQAVRQSENPQQSVSIKNI